MSAFRSAPRSSSGSVRKSERFAGGFMLKFFGRNFATGLLIGCVIAVGVAAAAITYERYDTKTLKRTVRRDAVYCGVNTGLPGFSSKDDKGNWSGFDVDFCRA